ncbi:MAG TPA: FAD-binding and (Fe-S)-binding domain-containing protein [Coriobacteriia bacterium]
MNATHAASSREPSDGAEIVRRLGLFEPRLLRVLGAELHRDRATRALYTSDASNYRVLPACIVTPLTTQQLADLVGLCREARVPLTMRGAGTSVAGNSCGPGVIVDTRRHLNAVLELDPESGTATVEPGVVLDDLNRLAAPHGLRVGPDPSTHSRCTIGGMVGNNACGPRSLQWGTTATSVVGLQIIRTDGRIEGVGPSPASRDSAAASGLDPTTELRLRALVAGNLSLLRRELPPWSRRVSGYALDWLLPERGFDVARALVGTEGTCGIVAAATVRLVRPPAARVLLVLGFPDDIAAATAVVALLAERPHTVEGATAELFEVARDPVSRELLPDGRAWLLVEAAGDDQPGAREHAARLAAAVGRTLRDASVRLLEDGRGQAALWRAREEGAGRASRLPDGSPAWPGLEDAAVPPERLGAYLTAFRSLLGEHNLRGMTYGHFGEGCIHIRIGFALDRPRGLEHFAEFMRAAADLIVMHGGTLSGEHGDGRARSALLPRMFSPAMLELFRQFKAIWDPDGILNPGIIIDPDPIEQGIRAAATTALRVRPRLAYSADGGDFRSAAQRCVGIGKCVTTSTSALMCPSYRATGDEVHSTRGRARLLQEMLAGSLSPDGWRSRDVRDSLDLCLACKGCLSECPTNVDMASYKAEFLYHHYRGRLRPRSHYALGWLPLWLRLTRRVPRFVNRVLRSRRFGRLFAAAAGIAPERGIPRLAEKTFVRSWTPQPPHQARGQVVLWPDTFNNYLTPEVAHAAASILADAGFQVTVPRSPVCCGLTWITTGQLDQARRVLRRAAGAPGMDGEEPIVVLEPSCAATLRSDALELLPDDPRVARLARRVTTLAELLDSVGYELPDARPVNALLQPHCHQQAILGSAADTRVLARAGVAVDPVLDGCCGMAGNFGAETGHQEISRAVAELELLPALSRVRPETIVLADGFSCRTQIEFLTGRRPLHLAELLLEQRRSEAERPPARRQSLSRSTGDRQG